MPVRSNQESKDSTLLIFEIADQLCAIAVESVQEIVPMAELARIPGQPSLLEGFLNLRGAMVPVVRIDRLYNVRAVKPELHTPLIIIRVDAHLTALLVTRVLEIVSFPSEALLPVEPNHSFNDCAVAQIVHDTGLVHVLAADRLLLEEERQFIAEFRARALRYLEELENRPA